MENPVASAQVAERTEQLLLASQWQKGHSLLDVALSEVFTLQVNRETRALCALKEFGLLPIDPNSVECLRLLKQVMPGIQSILSSGLNMLRKVSLIIDR